MPDVFDYHEPSFCAGTRIETIELEDGISCVTCSSAFIQINPFISGESVVNQDVVIWYGAHFLHDDNENLSNATRRPEVLGTSHVVGPDLRAVRW